MPPATPSSVFICVWSHLGKLAFDHLHDEAPKLKFSTLFCCVRFLCSCRSSYRNELPHDQITPPEITAPALSSWPHPPHFFSCSHIISIHSQLQTSITFAVQTGFGVTLIKCDQSWAVSNLNTCHLIAFYFCNLWSGSHITTVCLQIYHRLD